MMNRTTVKVPEPRLIRKHPRSVEKKVEKQAQPQPPPQPLPRPPERSMPFNGNPLFPDYLKPFLTQFNIVSCIETGTYKGDSTLWFADHLPEVHTIENNGALFEQNKAAFANKPQIRAHLGNSPTVMQTLLKSWSADKRCAFYLDAHWNDYWPLNDELMQIAQSECRDNCLILIDDFQVPNRPDIPFDSYHGQPLNFQFVEQALRAALPHLHYEYYAPPHEHRSTRGRLLAYPKHWQTS